MGTMDLHDVRFTRIDRQAETTRLLLEAQATESPTERDACLDQVVTLNIPVARSVASRYRNRGVATEDLEQVACLALTRAARGFDPSRSEDFLTYAVPSMRGELKRYFRDYGWTVRPPRRIQEIQARVSSEAARTGGGDDTVAALAARLELDVKDVNEAMQASGCFRPTSLDAGLDDTAHGSWLATDEREQDAAEARVMLGALAQELSSRDRLILYLRFVEGRTQSEIGTELGVTQMQVSRLLARILRDLRAKAGVTDVDCA